MTPRRLRRPSRRDGVLLLAIVTLAFSAAVAMAGPAGAVTPRPTDYRSTVESVEPPAPIAVQVIGGDTLLDLRAEPGHSVVVLGYGGEPYLRVQADGSAQVNQSSPAVSLNRSRDANISSNDGASVDAQPDWRTIGSDGRLIWHDHRIHVQDGADFTGGLTWEVPITVDDVTTVITGHLDRVDPPSPLPFVLLAGAVAASVWLLGRRRPRRTALMTLAVASLVASVTGYLEWQSLPAAVARNAGVFLLPVAAGLAIGMAAVLRGRTPSLVAMLTSVSLLAGWLAFRWSILTRSVLVSDLAPVVDRVGLTVVLGIVVAAAGLTVQWAGTPDPARASA